MTALPTAHVLDEPPLEFGQHFTHTDPRTGIRDFGPADLSTPEAPRRVRVGIVGPADQIPGLVAWLEKCRDGLPGKSSRYPNLFPPFPGFRDDRGYRCELDINDRAIRILPQLELDEACRQPGTTAVHTLVDMYLAQIEALTETASIDVILCPRPGQLDFDTVPDDGASDSQPETSFHDLLKARGMRYSVPLQVVRESTWTGKAASTEGGLQDAATRAWNLLNALYYKAGGTPWRFVRSSADLSSLYIGVSFFRTLDNSALHTAAAQVFNERGDGVIVRGNRVIKKVGRQPYLTAEDAHVLLDRSLERYRTEHQHHPARVVLHKTSKFVDDEIVGFKRAAADHRISHLDLVWVFERPNVRLFRLGDLPPLRGTSLEMSDTELLLYTRGTAARYGMYPGMYVPQPLSIRRVGSGTSMTELATEILALSKMNWNNTQYDGRSPITLTTARKVGSILRHLPEDGPHQGRYAYYM